MNEALNLILFVCTVILALTISFFCIAVVYWAVKNWKRIFNN